MYDPGFRDSGAKYFRHCSGQIYGVSRMVAQYIHDHGRAVQVDPLKPTSKAPGTMPLTLEYDKLHSNSAFNFNLRRYTTAPYCTATPTRTSAWEAGSSGWTWSMWTSGTSAARQGLTLVHFPAQPKLFWSHLPMFPCLMDWGKIMQPTLSHKLCLRPAEKRTSLSPCCQDCRGNKQCIASFQWGCSGVCDPLKNIPVIHNSCPQ